MGGMSALPPTLMARQRLSIFIDIVWRVIIAIQDHGGGQAHFDDTFWEQGSSKRNKETLEERTSGGSPQSVTVNPLLWLERYRCIVWLV